MNVQNCKYIAETTLIKNSLFAKFIVYEHSDFWILWQCLYRFLGPNFQYQITPLYNVTAVCNVYGQKDEICFQL